MRRRYPPYDTAIKPGVLVKPWQASTITVIYADKIKMPNDQRYYFWNEDVPGLVIKKMRRNKSIMDNLYPDIHVLIEDNVVIVSAFKIASISKLESLK